MDVKDGLATRVPRAALTGVTNAGLEATKMSKPPIASEAWTKTPTEKVSPTLNGPSVGASVEQLVAETEVVTQTRPPGVDVPMTTCVVPDANPGGFSEPWTM